MKLKSLRIRIGVLLAATLLVVLAMASYRAYEREQSDIGHALERMQNDTDLLAARQSEVLRNTEEFANFLTAGRDVLALASQPSCARTLARFLERHPSLDNIAIVLADGHSACVGRDIDKEINIADRAYFQQALAEPGTIIGEPVVSRATGNRVLPIATAIRERPGAPQAVLFMSLNLAWVSQEFAISQQNKDARMGLVNSNGTVLAHHPDPARMVGRNIAETPFFKTIIGKAGRGTGEEAGLDGEPRIYAFARYAETSSGPIYLWVSLYKRVVTGEATREFWVAVAIWLLLACGSFAAVWRIGERLYLRPLTALSGAVRRLSAGDYLARTGVGHGEGELGELAGMLDRMAVAMGSKAEVLRLNRALRVLSSCGNVLVHAESETQLLQGICRTIVEVGSYRAAWIGLRDHDADKTVSVAAHHGVDVDHLMAARVTWADTERGRGPSGTAIRTGTTQLVQDIAASPELTPWHAKALERGHRATVALPLRDRGDVFGVLCIFGGEANVFIGEEIALLEELAENLAFGILAHRSRAERYQAEEKADRLARFDVVTDLPNRVELIAHLGRAIARARQTGGRIATVAVTIDRLIDIQDAIGMGGADEILKQMAARLRALVGQVHFVGRMAGASFAVVVPVTVEDSAALALRLATIAETPFEYSGIPVDVQVTSGIAMFPENGDDPDALVRRADIAVRQAAAEGRSYAVYSGKSDRESPAHLTLLSDLRKAIRDGGLTLFYQPKVSVSPVAVSGAEALVRWIHPSRGMVPPNAFIPLAEQTGLVKPLTYSVLAIALAQMAEWERAGTAVRVAVNVSPNNLRDPDFFEQLTSMPRKFGARLDLLDLELTETALMADPGKSRDLLARFAELGVHIFIDDFGTGYSSLSYLATLPIHALKIDRSFVIQMKQPKFATIVASTITLAHSLGLKVVAEGVETAELVQQLGQGGCDEIQGYFYSKPLPAADFVRWCASFRDRELAT
jgi:diguanylate cyclase (GGDEF)-like protein